MLHTNFRSALVTFTLIVLCSTTFSFISKAGGDRYEIYFNDKLITEKYVGQSGVDVTNLQLDKTNYKDRLVIYYNHCGVVGTGRSIVLKDEKNNVLKEWKFADGTSAAMTIKVKDILDIQKKNAKTEITLVYYSSKYLPKGRLLTAIKIADKNTAYINTYRNKFFPSII